MKYIEKKSTVTIPEINGAVVDTLNVEDKITNAPSVRLFEEKTERNILSAWLSADITLTTGDNQLAKIPLNMYSSVGTKLTFDSTNNAIVIGQGVSKLKIYATMGFNGKTSYAGTLGLLVQNNNITDKNIVFSNNVSTREYDCLYLLPAIMNVEEGDIITLSVRSIATTEKTISVRGSGSGSWSNITMEVLE